MATKAGSLRLIGTEARPGLEARRPPRWRAALASAADRARQRRDLGDAHATAETGRATGARV